MRIKKIFSSFGTWFEPPVSDAERETFEGELKYECSKLFYVALVTLFVWLPYISIDISIHQHPVFAAAVRLGLTLLSIVICILRFTKRFRNQHVIMLKMIMAYLYIGAGILAATAGEAAISYTGGFTFIVMTALIAPFTTKFKSVMALCSFILYILAASLTGVDFNDPYMAYALRDLLVATAVFIVLSHLLHKNRYKAWEQKTELKRAIEENERNLLTISTLAAKAAASDRAKSEFLATMSHEIRTPLNAIIGIAQIQMQKDSLPDGYAEELDKIYSSGRSLLGIINDILDLSKIETGKLTLNPAEYEISNLISDAVHLNIVRIGSKPIEFEMDIDETLPSKLCGDELRLKQILNNLLSNAIKYTDQGHIKLSVAHETAGEEVTLHLSVEDTGQGMKPEDQERLFSEYMRFNTEANRSTEGAGLGLSITKRLVEMMDGSISVESEYGKGSIFTITLKQTAIKCEAIGAETVELLRKFRYAGGNQASRLSITREIMPYGSVLVVDDVDTNLYVAEGLLSLYQLKTDTASSGFATIDKINAGNIYDIVFMDHMMPQMDGIETTLKLRELGYEGTIVALTANALVGNEEMFRQNGFDGFISKPIDVMQLNSVLNRFIRDKYPDAAKSYQPEEASIPQTDIPDKQVLRFFRSDAQKAVETLRETIESGDLKLFTTTVHAMKSALANIGEHEASKVAAALEANGFSEDAADFIVTLEALLDKYKPDTVETASSEDTEYLAEQLAIIKTACESFDDDTAFAALDQLNEKQWTKDTTTALQEIRDTLFVYSDFEGAANQVNTLLSSKE